MPLALVIIALLVVLWFLFSFGPASHPPATPTFATAVNDEFKKFQGAWEFVSLEVDGGKKPDQDFKKYSVVFQGDQWTVSEGTNIAAQTTIELDPRTDPKTIDVFPQPGKGMPIHGIYLFEGDQLTICDRGEDKGDRPSEFVTKPGAGFVLIVFRRIKH